MPKPVNRAYSAYNRKAVTLLGMMIREARIERRMSAAEVASRAGISRGLLQRIEKGNPRCEIGAVFEAATVVGVRLFDSNETALRSQLDRAREKLALMPSAARRKRKVLHDEF